MAQRHSLSCDVAALGIFETKVLYKIFGPERVSNDFLIPRNRYLMRGCTEVGEEDSICCVVRSTSTIDMEAEAEFH